MANKVWRLFAMQWSTILQYRTDTILWTLAEAATPIISLAVWYAVARGGNFPLTPQETLTYYVVTMFVIALTGSWNGFFLAREILTGEIVPYLTRPVGVIWRHLASNVTEKAFKLTVPLVGVGTVVAIWPTFFSPAVYRWDNILPFLVSLVFASGVAFSLDITLGMLAFWLEDANELRRFKDLLHELSSGVLIPYAALPAWALTVFGWLPFRYIIAAPVEVLLGQAEGQALWYLLGIQIVWLTGLSLIATVMWRTGLRRYAVPSQ